MTFLGYGTVGGQARVIREQSAGYRCGGGMTLALLFVVATSEFIGGSSKDRRAILDARGFRGVLITKQMIAQATKCYSQWVIARNRGLPTPRSWSPSLGVA